ncbi:MAG: DUF3084 domain-containing protein [Halanaerobiaceae bacterium]|nr:DUF3084 domain-containing protein [Halanaerobiaceae bacterium]
MIGVLLIIAVILLSGLIAYLGDQIGMKVGKKRISVFGLRPKYTSIIITVFTGVLIAAFTITIILATNNSVRQALFNIQDVLRRLSATRIELENMNKLKEQLEMENVLLEEKTADLQKKLNNIQAEYDAAQDNIDFLTGTIENLNEIKGGLEEQLSTLKTERQNLEEHIELLNQEIRRINQELSDTTLRYYTQDLVFQRGDLIYLDVIEKKGEQEEIIDSIGDFLDKANQEVIKYPVKVDEEGIALRIDPREIYLLSRMIIESESERFILSLVAGVNVSQNSYVPCQLQVTEDFIVYNKDEIIARKVLDKGLGLAEIEEEIVELLETISINSIKKGIISSRGSVGSIKFINYYQLINEIQNMSRQVEIKVVAADDIWREDSWNDEFSDKIRFIIEPVGDYRNE